MSYVTPIQYFSYLNLIVIAIKFDRGCYQRRSVLVYWSRVLVYWSRV